MSQNNKKWSTEFHHSYIPNLLAQLTKIEPIFEQYTKNLSYLHQQITSLIMHESPVLKISLTNNLYTKIKTFIYDTFVQNCQKLEIVLGMIRELKGSTVALRCYYKDNQERMKEILEKKGKYERELKEYMEEFEILESVDREKMYEERYCQIQRNFNGVNVNGFTNRDFLRQANMGNNNEFQHKNYKDQNNRNNINISPNLSRSKSKNKTFMPLSNPHNLNPHLNPLQTPYPLPPNFHTTNPSHNINQSSKQNIAKFIKHKIQILKNQIKQLQHKQSLSYNQQTQIIGLCLQKVNLCIDNILQYESDCSEKFMRRRCKCGGEGSPGNMMGNNNLQEIMQKTKQRQNNNNNVIAYLPHSNILNKNNTDLHTDTLVNNLQLPSNSLQANAEYILNSNNSINNYNYNSIQDSNIRKIIQQAQYNCMRQVPDNINTNTVNANTVNANNNNNSNKIRRILEAAIFAQSKQEQIFTTNVQPDSNSNANNNSNSNKYNSYDRYNNINSSNISSNNNNNISSARSNNNSNNNSNSNSRTYTNKN